MTPLPPTPRFLTEIGMPLRDALRGVAGVAEAAEGIFAPVVAMLPDPMQAQLRETMSSLEQVGRRLTHPTVEQAQITGLADFLQDAQAETGAIEAARVVAFAWDALKEGGIGRSVLISETVVAESFADPALAHPEGGPARAARLLANCHRLAAIAPAPGFSATTITHGDEAGTGLLAIAIWALAHRPDHLEEEAALLTLSYLLVQASNLDIAECFADLDALAERLATMPAQL